MAETENLSIIIEVVDQFEEELDRLIMKLAEVEGTVQAVDPVVIEADVRDGEVDALLAKLAAIEGADVGTSVGGRRGGGGAAVARGSDAAVQAQTEALVGQLDTLRRSLVDEIADIEADVDVPRGGGGGGEELSDLDRALRDAVDLDLDAETEIDPETDFESPELDALRGTLDLDADADFDAGEAMGDVAKAAGEASDGLTEMDLRMTDIHNAAARLVPMLLTIVGAVPAIYGALVALAAAAGAAAAALAAITAFGAIGIAIERGGRDDMMGGLTDAWDQVVDDFLDAFVPLAQRLAPLFEDALDGLNRLFEQIASEGDALMDFADESRDFGEWVINTLPSFLNDLASFAEAAADALAVVGQAAGDVDWFGALANYLAMVLPPLMEFGALLAALTPHLLELSIGFLQATNGLLLLLNVFLDIITVGGMLDKQVGLLIGSFLSAYTVVLLLNSALVTTAATGLVSMGRTMIRLASILLGYVGVSGSAISSTLGLAASFKALAAAIALTGIGALVVIFGAIAGGAATASTEIDKATKSLKEFQRQQSRMSGGENPYKEPELRRGEGVGQSRFAGGGGVTVNVEGNADEDTLRTQTNNALYRTERPIRR